MIFWHTFSYPLHTQKREIKEKQKDKEDKFINGPCVYSTIV
jgi:hypothetical protein